MDKEYKVISIHRGARPLATKSIQSIILIVNIRREEKTMKTQTDRIVFYTRKAAQFSRIPIHLRKLGSLRFKRLMAYKELMIQNLLSNL